MSRLGRKRISRIGPGFAVIAADGVVLEGRWQTAEDAFEEGLLGVWLLSGMDVIKYDHCARCRQPIALDYDAATREPLEGAIWTTQAHGFDACTPGPNDEDRYHDPLHETPEEAS